MIKNIVVILLLSVPLLANQSPYIGKITLKPLKDTLLKDILCTLISTLDFTPLTQQPKITNFKHQLIQLATLTDEQSCQTIPQHNDDQIAKIAMIDLTHATQLKCAFNMKVQNLRKANYRGFILVIDSKAFVKNHCRMYDDNHFFTGVMDSQNFTIFKNYQDKGQQQYQQLFKSTGIISIQLVNSHHKLVEMWVSSLNQESYHLIGNFINIIRSIPAIQDKIEWMPRIATVSCTHGDSASCGTNNYIASCACQGLFCSPELRHKTPVPLVQQDIRQLLIFKQYGTKYLQYVEGFYQQCYKLYQKSYYSQQCSSKVMQKLKIDSYSINQLVNFFIDQCIDPSLIKQSQIYTTLIKDQRAFISYNRYPLILINKQIIEYNSKQELLSKICNKIEIDQQTCNQYAINNINTTTSVVSIVFYVLIIIVLIAAAITAVYLYRKRLRKDFNKEIKMQVSTAVEHYFALTETTNKE